MLKVIGAIIIIFCTAMVGLNKVSKMRKHERCLLSFCSALEVLELEISDRLSTTEESLQIIAQSNFYPANEFFANVHSRIGDLSESNFSEIWAKAIDDTRKLTLNDREKQTLKELGYGLGRYSSYEQKKLIEYCLRRFEDAHRASERELQRDSKVHAALGMSAGLFAVIIFI